jgi:hypothetical protein
MFRFTIRDVLWLMVVVAITTGWWVNRVQWQKDHDDVQYLKQRVGEKTWNEMLWLLRESPTSDVVVHGKAKGS